MELRGLKSDAMAAELFLDRYDQTFIFNKSVISFLEYGSALLDLCSSAQSI